MNCYDLGSRVYSIATGKHKVAGTCNLTRPNIYDPTSLYP